MLCIWSSLNCNTKSTLLPLEKPQTTPKEQKKPNPQAAIWSSNFWWGGTLNTHFLLKNQSSHFIHTRKHDLPATFNVTKMLTAHGGNIRSVLQNSWEGPGETLHKLCKHFVEYLVGTFLEHLWPFSGISEGMLGKCYGKIAVKKESHMKKINNK